VTVEVLAWRVRSKYNETKTLAMVKDGTCAIVLVVEGDSYVVHKSREFNSSAEAEDWLRDATADGDLELAPTVVEVESPPVTSVATKYPTGALIDDAPFRSWAEHVVLPAVEREAVIQALRSVTLKFGEPRPAFTR
jgi:hypothetical protein